MQEYTAVFQDIRRKKSVPDAEQHPTPGYIQSKNTVGLRSSILAPMTSRIYYSDTVSGTGGFKERIILTKPYKP